MFCRIDISSLESSELRVMSQLAQDNEGFTFTIEYFKDRTYLIIEKQKELLTPQDF